MKHLYILTFFLLIKYLYQKDGVCSEGALNVSADEKETTKYCSYSTHPPF